MNWLVYLAFGLSLAWASLGWAAANPAAELEAKLNQLTSLSASFDQLTQDGRGLKIQQSQGQVQLAKPKLFYWHTQQPYEQLVVSNGQLMWVYEPDLEQVTQQPVDEQLNTSPAFLLIDQATNLAKHYQITKQQQGDKSTFTLVPLQQETLFEELKLIFNKEEIASLQLTDSLGQKTIISLYLETLNQPLNPNKFNFIPPEGVDLIKQTH